MLEVEQTLMVSLTTTRAWARDVAAAINHEGTCNTRVTKTLIEWLKMQLSLKAREDQAVEVSNQNLNYQDFKFEVSKCNLVWTDIPSQQIFRIYWNRIRPHS
jgi:hypothetical protein